MLYCSIWRDAGAPIFIISRYILQISVFRWALVAGYNQLSQGQGGINIQCAGLP